MEHGVKPDRKPSPAAPRERQWVVLGLGSNVGDREANLALARELLPEAGFPCRLVSSLWETEPVGGPPGQGRFLNQAVAAERRGLLLSPERLLEACLRVEAAAGRRRVRRWGPRTLDIDVLLYGDERIVSPGLAVPHPRLARRAFALGPLAEILPDVVHPVLGATALELWRALAPGRNPCPPSLVPRTMPAARS